MSWFSQQTRVSFVDAASSVSKRYFSAQRRKSSRSVMEKYISVFDTFDTWWKRPKLTSKKWAPKSDRASSAVTAATSSKAPSSSK